MEKYAENIRLALADIDNPELKRVVAENLDKMVHHNDSDWAISSVEQMDTDELIRKVWDWFDDKGLKDPVMQFAKVNEEVGEMAHELTRGRYRSPEMFDAIGDTLVTIIGMCHHLKISPNSCLHTAYKEISSRKGKVIDGSFVKES